MTDQELEERLRRIEATRGAAGRAAAIAATREQARGRGGPLPGRHRVRLGLGALAAILIVLSPPGQALAEAIGDLAGIGEEPTETPLLSPGSANESEVIATGENPDGLPFEVVASVNSQPGSAESGVTCIYASFPSIERSMTSASCLTSAAQRSLDGEPRISPFLSVGSRDLGTHSDLTITATATADIESVRVTYRDQEGIEQEAPVPTIVDVAAAPASGEPEAGVVEDPLTVRFFVSFLPSSILGQRALDDAASGEGDDFPPEPLPGVEEAIGSIRVTGYDGNDVEIASTGVDQSPFEAAMISDALKERERPQTPRDLALATCNERLFGSVQPPAPGEPFVPPDVPPEAFERCVEEELPGP